MIIDLIKRYPAVVVTAALMITALGGTAIVELPADRKVEALEDQVAANWQEQTQYHEEQELEAVRWRMRYVSEQINRLNALPQYTDRALTEQELWQLKQLQQEWELLKEREMDLTK